ncbi:hypothetical protein TorRG33x02_254260, partial [Trema orientale]
MASCSSMAASSLSTLSPSSSSGSGSHLSSLALPTNLNAISIRLDRTNYSYWCSIILPAVRTHDLD